MKWEISVQVLLSYQSNYQKGEQGITETAGRMNITPVYQFPLEKELSKGRLLQRFLDITCVEYEVAFFLYFFFPKGSGCYEYNCIPT